MSDAWDVVGPQPNRLERTEVAQAGFDAHVSRSVHGEAHPIDWENGGCTTCPKPAKVSGDGATPRAQALDRLAAAQDAAFKSTPVAEFDGRWAARFDDSGNPKDAVGELKPPLHLVPAALTIQVSQAMKNGAAKYGPYNWREKKVRAHVYIAAAQRHLAAWFDGENVASDSGVHHLAHAAACLAILLDAEATGNLIDDRPPHGAAARLIDELAEERAA